MELQIPLYIKISVFLMQSWVVLSYMFGTVWWFSRSAKKKLFAVEILIFFIGSMIVGYTVSTFGYFLFH
jgi:hypothetical protein